MKANLLMLEHFDIDNRFCPGETVLVWGNPIQVQASSLPFMQIFQIKFESISIA